MRFKIGACILGLFLYSVCSESIAIDLLGSKAPSFVFQLGSTIADVKKDPKAKACKDLGDKDEEGTTLPKGKVLSCSSVSHVKNLNLSFFDGKLVTIRATFFSPTILSAEYFLALDMLKRGDSSYLEIDMENLGLLKTLREKCTSVKGEAKKEKVGESKNSDVLTTCFSELTKTDSYACNIQYCIANLSKAKPNKPNEFTFIAPFYLQDLKLKMLENQESKRIKDKAINENADKFKF